MIERPNDEPLPLEDPPPSSDPEPTPPFPKPLQANHDARPETLANNMNVTPLDEDKNIENGIEVEET